MYYIKYHVCNEFTETPMSDAWEREATGKMNIEHEHEPNAQSEQVGSKKISDLFF